MTKEQNSIQTPESKPNSAPAQGSITPEEKAAKAAELALEKAVKEAVKKAGKELEQLAVRKKQLMQYIEEDERGRKDFERKIKGEGLTANNFSQGQRYNEAVRNNYRNAINKSYDKIFAIVRREKELLKEVIAAKVALKDAQELKKQADKAATAADIANTKAALRATITPTQSKKDAKQTPEVTAIKAPDYLLKFKELMENLPSKLATDKEKNTRLAEITGCIEKMSKEDLSLKMDGKSMLEIATTVHGDRIDKASKTAVTALFTKAEKEDVRFPKKDIENSIANAKKNTEIVKRNRPMISTIRKMVGLKTSAQQTQTALIEKFKQNSKVEASGNIVARATPKSATVAGRRSASR